MRRGLAFTPDGPLTVDDLQQIVAAANEDHRPGASICEIRTPMAGDRRQVTVTVTDQIWRPPPPISGIQPETQLTEQD